MADETEFPNCDREFVVEALKDQFRIDGRGPQDLRNLSFQFSIDGLSSTVLMGNTRIFTTIRTELAEPSPTQPHQGGLFFEVDFSPMASPGFEAERRSNESIITMRMIERLLYFSKALDREALCIVAGQVVWNLRVNVHVLDHDGNLMDACCLGALSALCAHRRPEVEVDPETKQVVKHAAEEREPLPLTLHHLPIPVTFAFFEDGSLFVLDPDLKEEAATTGSMTIVVDPQGHICGIHKVKGIGLSLEQTMNSISIAVDRGQEIAKILQEALTTHEVARVKSRVKRRDDGAFMSQFKGRTITAVPRVAVDSEGVENTIPDMSLPTKDDSSEQMESSSESQDEMDSGPQENDVVGLLDTSGQSEEPLPVKVDEAAPPIHRPVSKLPQGEMDKLKIQQAAAFIAGVAEGEEQDILDLKDAVKQKAKRI